MTTNRKGRRARQRRKKHRARALRIGKQFWKALDEVAGRLLSEDLLDLGDVVNLEKGFRKKFGQGGV